MRFRRSFGSSSGFTLLELLVTIGILGVIAAIGIAQFSTYNRRSVDARTLTDLRNGASAEHAIFADTEQYITCANATLCAAAMDGIVRFSPATELQFTATNPTAAFTGSATSPRGSKTYTWDSNLGGLQ